MGDFGIKVSRVNSDIATAAGADILMNVTYPFAKLDTSNTKSFQNIILTFENDPPEPTGAGADIYLDTLVYSFNHGYTYTPSFWNLIQITTPVAGTNFDQDYFQEVGVVAATTAADGVAFFTEVTDTAVNYYIEKYYDSAGFGSTNDITGLQLTIRPYVFVEDLIVV